MMKKIKVAAGVIRAGGKIFITSRTMAGGELFWEFPGGKLELNETPAQAAVRELKEELNLDALAFDVIYHQSYEYPDKSVELFFVRMTVADFSVIKNYDNQKFKWVEIKELHNENLLAADWDFARFLNFG